MFSSAGRRALVTGGSSGIGLAMAGALVDAGAEVVLVGRDEGRLRAAAGSLGDTGWIAADVSDDADVERVATTAGPVDILVSAAGINPRPPLGELSRAGWDRTLAVNLTGPFLLGQHLGPAMAARGWGRILHLGSQQSWRAFGNSGAYGVAKAAILGLTRSQAEAWSPSGVTVNCVIPGFVRTAMTEATFRDEPERAEALAARTMVGRNGRPEDFRGITTFLCSDEAAYLTGQAIAVDGGFSAT